MDFWKTLNLKPHEFIAILLNAESYGTNILKV
jgi:hypothetical protein